MNKLKKDVTDFSLFVRTTDETFINWNRQKIVDALVRETDIAPKMAEKISKEVEKQIMKSEVKVITSSLIRELVDAKLIEYDLEYIRNKHARLGMPIYEVEQLLFQANKENANVPHNPEATNLVIAENVKKEYALLNVFEKDIADAHINGDIHIHDLGFIDRPYCSGQNLEYVKKFGLQFPHSITKASPAKHAESLIGHLMKFSACLQGNFAGAIGWDAVNLFLAPYLVNKSQENIKQLAQVLIYEFSQQAVARGGQAIFSDINLYWEIPEHFKNVEAIGPGGKYTGYPYAAYMKESQTFIKALFEIYLEGDASGSPFFFPKPLLHITNKFWETEGHEEFLELACTVASKMGNTYFVFDRGKTAKISECCRLSFKLTDNDLKESNTPWKMRYSALQNVSINLPRIAIKAKGDESIIFNELDRLLYYAASAHVEKRTFIKSLIDLGKDGPLSLLAMKLDDEIYLKMNRLSYLIGMVGLNEMVKLHIGKEMHESDIAFRFGLKVISHMNLAVKKLSQQSKMHYVLEQTPAESTAYRFARLDQKYYDNSFMQGELGTDNVYYTNSTHFNVSADLNPFERVQKEGLFHSLIDAGSISHVWLGEHLPDPKGLMNFVKKTFYKTQNDQIAFSCEFTNCLDCHKTNRGLSEKCSYCGSFNVEGITRITGYYTKISSWNKGKLAELKDRRRTNI